LVFIPDTRGEIRARATTAKSKTIITLDPVFRPIYIANKTPMDVVKLKVKKNKREKDVVVPAASRAPIQIPVKMANKSNHHLSL